MTGIWYLAWRYLVHHRFKTGILVVAIALVMYLPAAVQLLVAETAEQLGARAEQTPLLAGAEGGELELVLKSLYFHGQQPAPVNYRLAEQLRVAAYGEVIPLYVRFSVRGAPIVGTEPAYFEKRHLRIEQGRPIALLGEAVIGSAVARSMGVGPGDFLVSNSENVFDIAGVYPLKMKVVGVLAPSYSADDEAVFVDVKTTWIIEGLGHGHQDLTQAGAASNILKRDSDGIVANAAVVQYNEITSDNINSFHFHGSSGDNPLTGLLVFPHSHKDETLLLGQYQSGDFAGQLLRPGGIVQDLLQTVFSIRQYVLMAMAIVAAATLVLAGLIFLLSARLRQGEVDTMLRIGSSRATVMAILASEVVIVLVLSMLLALVLTLATRHYGLVLMQSIIMA